MANAGDPLKSAVLLCALSVPVAACTPESESVDPASTVAAIELAEVQSGLLPDALLPKAFPLSLEGTDPGTTPEQAAESVAVAVESGFEPAGCASASVDGASVSYVLQGCRPSRGLGTMLHPDHGRGKRHSMSATFTLTFQAIDGGLSATIAGTKVGGRGAEHEISGQAKLLFDGDLRTLVVETEGTGIAGNGQTLSRKSSHTRTYDVASDCFTLDGQWLMTGPHGSRERSVSGYRQCGDFCPESGTLVGEGMPQRHGGRRGGGGGGAKMGGNGECGGGGPPTDAGNARDVIVTVELDGSAEASWSTDAGESGAIPLACTPVPR